MVLKQDVPNLGFRGEEVSVKAGYARNFLYPEKLAVYATPANLEKFKVDKESVDEVEAERERAHKQVIARITSVELVLKRHTAARGETTLHSSVTAQNISDMLEKQHGIIVGVARVNLPTPIKTLGSHTVKIRVDDAVEAEYAAAVAAAGEGETPVLASTDEATEEEEAEAESTPTKAGPSKKKEVKLQTVAAAKSAASTKKAKSSSSKKKAATTIHIEWRGARMTLLESKVYELLLTIPAGKVSTYGGMAKALGSGPRPVGQALRKNPFAPEVPCHRVVAADLSIGGFKGSVGEDHEHIKEKRTLLAAEGVTFADDLKVDSRCLHHF
ncbi:hypothetical protein PybrP1_004031 [[Pythium] brassicae (nom. inval.)]|nr:hypothetical protein PybrP1_004031 [[Pythium] brassicae (nom. inval.)]